MGTGERFKWQLPRDGGMWYKKPYNFFIDSSLMIIVTGGAGFIGSNIVAALEKAGREKYEAAHGPVIKTSVANQKDFSVWIANPWPWDYMEGGSK